MSDAPLLDAPLAKVVGDRTAKALTAQLGLHTVEDLLRHYPRRYADRGQLTDLASIQLDEHVTVMAEIAKVTTRRMRARRGSILEVIVTDGINARNNLALTFFNQAWREKDLQVGRRGLFSGKVGSFNGTRQLSHPDYLLIGGPIADADVLTAFAAELLPMYPATGSLASWRIAQAVRVVLDVLEKDLADPLSEDLRAEHNLLGLREAFVSIHRPTTLKEADAAKHRFRWEEAFVLQIVLAQRRAAMRSLPAVPRTPSEGGLLDAFDARMPFDLTAGQQAVEAEILADLAESRPMNRLLQGDVGAGKTIVALRAMLTVIDAGGQAALLAPTEVLAQQHHRSLTGLLGPLAQRGQLGGAEVATRVALLTGSSSTKARRTAMLDAASGDAGIVIGTHALLEKPVDFFDLGLAVIDEQHRFGVEQRDALRAKGTNPPHVLVMTATPIPRTVAMTVFGDLDTSTLRELPAGRQPIQTTVVPAGEQPSWMARVWQRINEEVALGRRAYVVCPRIGDEEVATATADSDDGEHPDELHDEDTETLLDLDDESGPRRPPAAVIEVGALLAAGPLADLRVEVLHGRQHPDAKDDRMRRFAAGDLDVLVSTTVIEVGVDVPEATVMVVLDADRFGISQLHQLRGRVGRGTDPGLCLLVTDAPAGTPARDRLEAVAATTDGFDLALLDLQSRREGDVLGAAQSGRRTSLRLLSVLRDEAIIVAARAEASRLVEADPELAKAPDLARAVEQLLDEDRTDFLVKA